MDLGTIIGFAGAYGIIFYAIIIGGSITIFIDIPSVLIVLVGSTFTTLIKYPLGHTFRLPAIMKKTIFHKEQNPLDLIEKGVELANIARKDGLLGLENVEIPNEFMGKGIQLAVDGQPPEVVSKILSKEMNLAIERHDLGKAMFKGIGETAPAMGMIGTLIGLVQMMSNMADPSSIGPAMAVALLTTLYGALVSNVLFLPMADKLDYRAKEERLHKSLVLETVNGIQSGINPKVLQELLVTYLRKPDRPVVDR